MAPPAYGGGYKRLKG